MILRPFYLLLLVFIGIALLAFAYGLFSYASKKPKAKSSLRKLGNIGDAGVCPVCSMQLVPGEQLKTALFPGKETRTCHIFGCPHCHPFAKEGITRICPVCKRHVPQEGYLIARLFERPGKKRHVHILGCTECRAPKKN
ncbi:MAG TPA: hypothetical protein PKO22_01060 [Treponemataceae bacterium]|nr:hypothetical protein [Treponemataceae bacterium]